MAQAVRAASWIASAGSAAGLLVFTLRDLCTQEQLVRVFGSAREDVLDRQLRNNRDGSFEMLPVNFGQRQFFLALRGFRILKGEDQKRSPGSQALYLAECDLGDHGYLVQYLGAGMETSSHAHETKEEIFHSVLGLRTVKLGHPGRGRREVNLRESLYVPPLEFHQVVTREWPALTIIEVFGPNPLGMDDYIRP